MDSILTSIASKFAPEDESEKGQTELVQNTLSPNDMNHEKLSSFLRCYAPCQLVIDRRAHSKKLNFAPQRVLSTLTFLRSAHMLVNKASSGESPASEKYLKLSQLLDVHPKAALPHPQWRPVHDAILVTAITKHGWIDRDSHCRAIIEDSEIKWGAPFEKPAKDHSISEEGEANASSDINANSPSSDSLKRVAERAADFLNKEQESMKDAKGFNLNLVLKSYSIVSSENNDAENSAAKWEVDYEEFENNLHPKDGKESSSTEDDFVEADLPTRKDLLRRAKTLLSRPLVENGDANAKSSSITFGVLDQSNVCNVFLAELLREAIKVGQKQQKLINKLLASALTEAQSRSEECSDTVESAELKKISKHIGLATQHSKPFVRAAKNVLRAILGVEMHQPSKPGESLFVTERKPLTIAAALPKKKAERSTSTKKSPNKSKEKRKPRGVESTTGDAAVNKALSIGKCIERNLPIPNDSYLKLTSIETLMLSVLCSQGMPICEDNWRSVLDEEFDDDESYALTWFQTGSVLEAAAETWYGMTAGRVARARENAEIVSDQLAAELISRQMVYNEAGSLRQNPSSLAKKAIMLVQALRLHTGNRLKGANRRETTIGMRTLQWSSNHMVKWSQGLGIFFDGKVLSNTVIAARPDIIPAAFVDEKGCAAIYSQIVQQSRLRSLYLKYEEDALFKMLPKAVKMCDANEGEWEDRPSWWDNAHDGSTTDDESLIAGILQYGYGGFDEMVRQDERFADISLVSSEDTHFDRLSAQKRLDCLTRELGAIDDKTESIRLVNERKQNPSVARLENGTRPLSSANAVQVGIDAFFMPKKVTIEEISDDSSIEVVEVSPVAKRKEPTSSLKPGKKTKPSP